MFTRLRERCNRLLAEALPPRLAYFVALRVLAHAACTKLRDVPARDVKALEALEHWQASMLPQRVARSLGRLRSQPKSPPLWQAVGETLRPRDLAPGEVLEAVEVDRLETVRVVGEGKGKGQGA